MSIHNFYVVLQVEGNINSGNLALAMFSRDCVTCVPEVSQSSASEYAGSQKKVVKMTDFGTSVNEESDNSDFEIFRVKRRSSTKTEQRNAQNPVSVNPEHQVQHTKYMFACYGYIAISLNRIMTSKMGENSIYLFVYVQLVKAAPLFSDMK